MSHVTPWMIKNNQARGVSSPHQLRSSSLKWRNLSQCSVAVLPCSPRFRKYCFAWWVTISPTWRIFPVLVHFAMLTMSQTIINPAFNGSWRSSWRFVNWQNASMALFKNTYLKPNSFFQKLPGFGVLFGETFGGVSCSRELVPAGTNGAAVAVAPTAPTPPNSKPPGEWFWPEVGRGLIHCKGIKNTCSAWCFVLPVENFSQSFNIIPA